MNHQEALTITQMVLTTWPTTRVWDAEEITTYAAGLQKYEAEACTRAVAAAQQKLMYRPSVAELREFYDIERAKTRAATEPYAEQPLTITPPRLPDWVKGWCCARYHHKDMRVWSEQDQHGLSGDKMPDDARGRYILEGQSLTIEQVFSAIGT